MDEQALKTGLAQYVSHLREIARAFNDAAAETDLPVRMDPDSAINAVMAGVGLARIAPFWSRTDDTGVVHEGQLKTAIDCLRELRADSKRCGHVVGAMQSGKTTTSLALQWAGPVLYLLTGERAYPFYVIGNQTNHEDQTKTELDRFLAYYGNVVIKHAEGTATASGIDAMFLHSPSLNTYREHVLRGALEDVFAVAQIEDMVHRRVGGEQSVRKIAELCKRAKDQGYRPLMMIDEPQFGASDRIVANESGPHRHRCVLAQIFERIERELASTRNDHWFVGLSATPFELNDLDRVWEVRQYLAPAYSGFNFFNGRPISSGVTVLPPTTMGLTEFAAQVGIDLIADISMAAYAGSQAAFDRHAKRIDFDGDQVEYQGRVVDALREAIYEIVAGYREEEPDVSVGLCIRAFNDNAKTEALIGRLALDPARVEVIEYYGPRAAGYSVKRVIAKRAHPELPYVVFVTNRARMADAFPVEVRFFLDFAQKATDLNALLQGLLGRACGYNKRSTVVLSDANAAIVEQYVATSGGYVHKTSRHSIPVGGFRRGAPSGMLKLRVEMDDPVVAAFFREIDAQVVEPNLLAGSPQVRMARARNGFRTGPILNIASTLNLFDHIEQPAVRAKLFPEIPTGFKVARAGDRVKHTRDRNVTVGYGLDEQGNCRYTFRWSDRNSAAQGGAAGRAMGAKDVGQHMEPTVYIEKYDPKTSELINDRDAKPEARRGGNWRAFMVTFPLMQPVREVRAATVAFPIEASPYSDWMEPQERDARDRAEAEARNQRRRGDADNA